MKMSKIKVMALILCIVTVLSVFAGCTSSEPITENKITEAVLSGDNQDKIAITAHFTENMLSTLEKGAKLYLFEYTSDMDVECNINTLDLEPLAEEKAKSKVEFEIDLYDGVRTRRNSSFCIATRNSKTGKYNLETPLHAITFNSENGKNDKKDDKAAERSIKGLISDDVAGAMKFGISNSMVDVHIEDLVIGEWEKDAVEYVYNGKSYYIDKAELEKLDKTVRTYTDLGVKVYLRFILGAPSADAENAVKELYFSKREEGAVGYLVNMQSNSAAMRMEGFFDFIAGRYSKTNDASDYQGSCRDFIIGKNVNNFATYANAGLAKDSIILNYEKLVRIADASLAKYNDAGKAHAYISIDSGWTEARTGGCNGQEFLTTFSTTADSRGDFEWYVACDIYEGTSTLWLQSAGGNLTMDNYEANLAAFLELERHKFNGVNARRIIISDIQIPGVAKSSAGESIDVSENQAVSYAYAYVRALGCDLVDAVFYGAHYDGGSGRNEGLMPSRDSNGSVRQLAQVFKKVDTDESGDVDALAKELIGLSYEQTKSSLGEKARPVKYTSGEAKIDSDLDNSTQLFGFAGDLNGFKATTNTKYTQFTESDTYSSTYMKVALERKTVPDMGGVYKEMSAEAIMGAGSIVVPLSAGSGEATSNNSVTLRLYRKAKGAVADSDGDVIYESTAYGLSGTKWNTVEFNVSEFTKHLEKDDTVVLSLWAETPETPLEGQSYLSVQSISVKGAAGATGAWGVVIIIIVVLLVLAMAGAVVYLMLKRKGYFDRSSRRYDD